MAGASSIGCTAESLVDSMAFCKEIISESLAVAEGVNRTRFESLRLPVRLGALVSNIATLGEPEGTIATG
jgi:hypothetical protein